MDTTQAHYWVTETVRIFSSIVPGLPLVMETKIVAAARTRRQAEALLDDRRRWRNNDRYQLAIVEAR